MPKFWFSPQSSKMIISGLSFEELIFTHSNMVLFEELSLQFTSSLFARLCISFLREFEFMKDIGFSPLKPTEVTHYLFHDSLLAFQIDFLYFSYILIVPSNYTEDQQCVITAVWWFFSDRKFWKR